MTELLPQIRNAARALIVSNKKVLLLKKDGGKHGERFALPGGSQDAGETLQQALNRECIEEIGTSVKIGELLHVADYFKYRDTQPPTRRHLVEFLFNCSISTDYSPHNGNRPDKHQLGVLWVNLEELPQLALFPPYLTDVILHRKDAGQSAYLGAFHNDATS